MAPEFKVCSRYVAHRPSSQIEDVVPLIQGAFWVVFL